MNGRAKVVAAVRGETAAPAREGDGQVASVPVIEVRGLRKSYDGFEAVAGIDLEVRAGEVFAFLGPNGAGKTTTVEILEGYRRRDAGEVSVLGTDPADEVVWLHIPARFLAIGKPSALERVASLARGWFGRHFARRSAP